MRCLPDQIEALVELGRLDEAGALLGRLEGWARRLARPSTLALSTRCRGLLLAAEGDREAALAALERSAAFAEQVPIPFELARTLLALGTEQRRARLRTASPRLSRRRSAERLGGREPC